MPFKGHLNPNNVLFWRFVVKCSLPLSSWMHHIAFTAEAFTYPGHQRIFAGNFYLNGINAERSHTICSCNVHGWMESTKFTRILVTGINVNAMSEPLCPPFERCSVRWKHLRHSLHRCYYSKEWRYYKYNIRRILWCRCQRIYNFTYNRIWTWGALRGRLCMFNNMHKVKVHLFWRLIQSRQDLMNKIKHGITQNIQSKLPNHVQQWITALK